jgi:hypothetical protein
MEAHVLDTEPDIDLTYCISGGERLMAGNYGIEMTYRQDTGAKKIIQGRDGECKGDSVCVGQLSGGSRFPAR